MVAMLNSTEVDGKKLIDLVEEGKIKKDKLKKLLIEQKWRSGKGEYLKKDQLSCATPLEF